MRPERAQRAAPPKNRGTFAATMPRKEVLRMGGLGLTGSAISMLLPGVFGSRDVASANAAANPVALGTYVPSLPWSFADVDEFTELVGRKPAVIHWFQDWVMDFDPAYMDAAVSRNGTPLVSWEPWRFGGGLGQAGYTLRQILDGAHDDYIRRWARAAARWGKTFYLRFAHEMNGDWTTWSPGVGGNTSREFVAVWRKVHTIFQREGATNVVWVWAPVAHYEGATPYEDLYPGDAYVGWVGLSGYNWGDTRAWSRWQGFYRIFGESYDKLVAMTNKRILVAETASAESGGDKATWISSAFLEQIPTRFPRIRAVVWFHVDKENDWRVDSSERSLMAYKTVASSDSYRGRLPTYS